MPHVIDIIKREIISQYNESITFVDFLEALASEGEAFSLAVENVNKFRTLAFSERKNLDVLGLLVGQGREVVDTNIQVFFGFDPDPLALSFTDLNDLSLGGRYRSASELEITTRRLSDVEYRSVISAAIKRNISNCTPNEIIQAVMFVLGLLGPVPKVELIDGNTYYLIYIGRILNIEEKAFLSTLNLLPKPAGVRVGYVEYDPIAGYFGFIEDGQAKGFGSIKDQLLIGVSDLINPGILITQTFRLIIIDDEPTGYWTFSETPGSPVSVNEMSGPDASNSPISQFLLGQVALKIGDITTSIKHILPSGKSEISLPPNNPLNNLIELSIEVVFMIDSSETASRRTLISHQFSAIPADNNYWLYIENDNQIGITISNLSSALSQPIAVDTPHYLVFTRHQSGAVFIYVDNVLILNAGVYPIINSLGNIFVGNDFGTRTTPSLLFISDVAIYNSVLTLGTINDHYNAFFGDLLRLIRDYETVTVARSNVLSEENGIGLDSVAVVNMPIISDYQGAIIADSPISYWRVGEINGTIAIDEMNLQDGNYVGSPALGSVGLVLNDPDTSVGLSDNRYVIILTNQQYSFTDGINDKPFSFELLIRLTSLTDDVALISKTGTNFFNENEYLFNVNIDGSLSMRLYDQIGSVQHNWTTLPGTIVVGLVYHVIATYTGSTGSGLIYVNSIPKPLVIGGTGYSFMKPNTMDVTLGIGFITDGSFPVGYFNGLMDEVAIYNYVLTPTQVQDHFNLSLAQQSQTYQSLILSDNPITYLRLGEFLGSDAIDEMAFNNFLYRNTPTLGVPGLVLNDPDTAVRLFSIGSQHLIHVNQVPEYSFTDGVTDLPFSIEALINLTSMLKANVIASKTNIPAQLHNEYQFRIEANGLLSVYLYTGNTFTHHRWETAPGIITPNQTYHVVATYNGAINTGQIYINGIDIPVSYINNGVYTRMMQTVSSLKIGIVFPNDTTFEDLFNGVIDEFAIYNYQLTAAQIANHYNAANFVPPPTNKTEAILRSNPVSYYRLDESTGTTGADQLGGPSVYHSIQVAVGAPAITPNDPSLSAGYESNTWLQKSVITPIATDAINISGDISIEFLFVMNSNDPFQDRTLLTRISSAGSFSIDYYFYISGNTLFVQLPDTASLVSSPNDLIPDQAYHIAVTINATTMALYRNGVLLNSTVLFGPRVPTIDPIYFGNDEQNLPLLGRLSDVAFYDRILSNSEIIEHANFGLGG